MNFKKIIIMTVLTVMILGCISTASAGWFDNKVECDTFKFDCPKGYSIGPIEKNNVILYNDNDKGYEIRVAESNEEEYATFLKNEYNKTNETNSSSNNETNTTLKDIKEDNMRIVSLNKDISYSTSALMQKDGKYYKVNIKHGSDGTEIDQDVQIIKDIYKSLEKK